MVFKKILGRVHQFYIFYSVAPLTMLEHLLGHFQTLPRLRGPCWTHIVLKWSCAWHLHAHVGVGASWACSWSFHEHKCSWELHEHAHGGFTSTKLDLNIHYLPHHGMTCLFVYWKWETELSGVFIIIDLIFTSVATEYLHPHEKRLIKCKSP